jgi:hypothetical protein
MAKLGAEQCRLNNANDKNGLWITALGVSITSTGLRVNLRLSHPRLGRNWVKERGIGCMLQDLSMYRTTKRHI